jgi:enterochelin esterase-like enzyme
MRKKTIITIFILFGLSGLFLSACRGFGLPGFESTDAIQRTIESVATQFTPQPQGKITTSISTQMPVTFFTETPFPNQTATIEKLDCTHFIGTIEYREIVSDLSPNPLAFRIYLPPCYSLEADKRYPVLYMLHGQTYNDDQWDRLGIDTVADQLINSGEAKPFIVVMPWESNSLEDDKTSIFGRLVIEVLIPFVDDEYRTCNARECRAIGGLSRGAAWSMRLGFTNWKLFSSIGAHSYAPFPGDFYNFPFWLKEIPDDKLPRIYMDMGVLDFMMTPASLFEERLTKYLVPHEWIINSGTHNEEYWGTHVKDYLYWYTFPWRNLSIDTTSVTPPEVTETPQ